MLRILASFLMVSALALCGLWLTGSVVADVEKPLIPKAAGEQCVDDTDLMRRRHMQLLNHQRDETVLDGVRGNPYSLIGCVDCHAQKDASGNAIRVDAEGQFCQSCHAYAAVKIDCFSCHAAVPEMSEQSASRLPWSDLYSSLKIPSLELAKDAQNARHHTSQP